MDNFQQLQESMAGMMPLILALFIWDLVWKLVGMWRAGRNNHLVWFICMGIINTLGVLPIIYLLLHKKKG